MAMSARKILVVEDDAAIRRGIVDALAGAGYEMVEAATFATAVTAATTAAVDLVLLDLILPGGDGLDLLRQVRQTRPDLAGLPVIILTARGAEADRVRGLQLGADDYVVKPFSVRELLARVAAVIRRSPQRPHPPRKVRFTGGWADLDLRHIHYRDGSQGELSEREAELLGYLAANAGRPVSRDEILRNVWLISGGAAGVETRTIDMHVARLREKLGDDAAEPKVLQTIRGKGYLFRNDE